MCITQAHAHRIANVQERTSLGHTQGIFLDFRIFSCGHGQFCSHDSIDFALEGRDRVDPLCVQN